MAKRIFAGFTLTLVVLAVTYTLKAQEKWNITAGAGFPEFLNIGASYQFNQAQAGLSGILIPFAEGIIFSVSADYYRHFGSKSKFSVRKPWYLRPNLNFTSSGDKDKEDITPALSKVQVGLEDEGREYMYYFLKSPFGSPFCQGGRERRESIKIKTIIHSGS